MVAFVIAGLLAASLSVSAQPTPKPADPVKSAALKLPDGTVVLFTPNPDLPNPPVDGVLLSGKEYQGLLDQADQLRRLKDAPKPQPPSRCQVRARVDTAGTQPVAVVAVTYSFRTTVPRTVVSLGGQRGQPRSAKASDGRLPVLGLADDGLTVLADPPGDHTLTVEFEVPVTARGANKESGFELGLPRAPVTTFAFDPPPAGKGLTVGVRTPDRPGDVQRATYRADAALGPTDLLDVAWEPPAPPGAAGGREPTAESEITVRVDETQVETTAAIRLRGPNREWQLVLPAGADVSAGRAATNSAADTLPPAGGVTVGRPTDPARPVWTVRVPEESGAEWLVTAVVRQPRTRPADKAARVSYPVGPVAVPAARHAGTVRVSAPPAAGLRFRTGPDARRQDVPAGSPDDLVALFRFTAPPRPGDLTAAPLLAVEVRPAVGFVRVEPAYRLRLTPVGWALNADLKIAPVRAEVDEFRVEMPAGWAGGVEASARRAGADAAAELVDEVEVQSEGDGPRELVVRFAGSQKAPFDLTLTAVHPAPAGEREATIPLPRFARGVIEQAARLSAEVPAGFEVRGVATARDRGQPGEMVDLKPAAASGTDPRTAGGATAVTTAFDRGVGQVALSWQPHRPELAARIEVEITLQDRQAVVAQTVHLRTEGGAWRAVRFRGPAAATPTLNAPLLRQAGDGGEWEWTAPAGSREAQTLALSYALPVPARPGRLDLGLFWPEAAARVDTQVRVWGGPGVRRVAGFDGPWQRLSPEPAEGRDALPWLTLAGSGAGLKLGLDLADPANGPLPGVWVERARLRAWVGKEAVAVHGRFLLRRWSASGVDLSVPDGVIPEVFVDGRRADNLLPTPPWADTVGGASVRVPLPESKAGRAAVTLDVWYPTPAPDRPVGPVTLTPPQLGRVAVRGPTRWQVFAAPGVVPLDPGGDLRVEAVWAWRNGLLVPTPGGSDRAPDGGFPVAEVTPIWAVQLQGMAPAELISGRQPEVGPVTLYRVPRPAWVVGCSTSALLAALGLSRLRAGWLGPTLAVLGVAAAGLTAAFPQPAAEVAAGCQPGAWGAASVMAGQAAARWHHRRRATHLPGFTRTRPGASGAVTESRAPVAPAATNPSGSAATPNRPSLSTPAGSDR